MYKRILVALDQNEESEQVLPWVRALALPQGASIVLVHVCKEAEVEMPEGRVVRYVDEVEAQRRQEASAYLERVARDLRRAGLAVEVVVRFGEPAEKILEVAREVEAGLIAMVTRARSGVHRLFGTSLGARLLCRADVPVLLLRREEHLGRVRRG